MGSLINPLRRFALPSFLNFGYTYTLWVILAYVLFYFTDIGFSLPPIFAGSPAMAVRPKG
jgi:hypothetical protein